MTETKTHVVFDKATSNISKDDEDKNSEVFNAIDLSSDEAFIAKTEDPEKESVCIECTCDHPCQEEIDVLEIAFYKGKLRKTRFSVDYIDSEDKKHHVGTYESKGETNSYEKFIFPEKVKDIKGLVITFKGNNDRSPWFGVKAIRLAKFIEKTL